MEAAIAQSRLMLSLIAMVAVYVDPTAPTMPWLSLTGGEFSIDPYALAVMTLHVAYSLAAYYALVRGLIVAERLARVTTWADVAFGAAIVVCTEGSSSPFWAFFIFAVIAAGSHGGFRRSMAVTTISVAIYLILILMAWQGTMTNFYIMRPVYLAVVGYLTAYLGHLRQSLETEVHRLESVKQRNRIARALHDGCVQTLGGVNLTLESCQLLLRAGRDGEAQAALAELQTSINREHDELRTYVRELADVETRPSPVRDAPPAAGSAASPNGHTRFVVSADFAGSAPFVDQVLQIVREAVTNVKRHAHAQSAAVTVRAGDAQVLIAVDDDGVGFADPEQVPWSMSSRVSDVGGVIRVARDARPGAHLRLALPEG
jgi:signal transduction histidine kinase